MKTSTKLFLINLINQKIEEVIIGWDGSMDSHDNLIEKLDELQEIRKELIPL